MFSLGSPYSPGKNRSFIFLAVMSISVLLLLIGSGCDPSGGQDARLKSESDTNPSSNAVSEEEASAKPNDSLGTIDLIADGASRSRGNAERSVASVVTREVLPGMGNATGSFHLLSIGIDQYVEWPKLQTARHGAESVARVLTNEYAFFEPENVRILLDNDATEQNILAELRDLANAGRVTPEDSIIIYYAGHGHLDDLTSEGSWIPWESDTENPSAWIPNVRIKTTIAATPARHVFLISDSCFSGDFFRARLRANEKIPERGIEIIANQEVDRKFRMRSRSGLSSGSIEPVMDGGAEGHSVFTYFFLRALQGTREPYVLPQDLYYRVYNAVKASDAEQTPQFAPLSGTNGELGQFVLFRQGGDVVKQQLEAMRERNNRLEEQMKRIAQEQADNAQRQAEQEAELAKLQEEIDLKNRQIAASTGTSTASGSDEFSELVANFTQLNTVRANQAAQLQLLKDREAKLKAEKERIERERRMRELAAAKSAFDQDYQAYTNLLANPFTQNEQKLVLWKAIARKYGVTESDLEELGSEPGELEWDGEGVQLGQAFLARLESQKQKAREEQERLAREAAEKERLAKEAAEFFGKLWTVPNLGLKMVWIEPGTFWMGSPSGEDDRDDDETRHQVRLTEGFWLGKYEVTQGEWEQIMGNNPSYFTSSGKRAPVEQVSWLDAQEFIKKLNERERSAGRLPDGYEYSLPTEAQWEYACRAGTETPFAFGSSLSSRQANFDGDYPYGGASKGPDLNKTTEVGSYSPNAWGLYDMHGNVWEWCKDWYDEDYYKPGGSTSGSARVIRGGSWDYDAGDCRSASRVRSSPSSRISIIGFRLALSSASDR